MPDITLSPEHASELTELLKFINTWLASDYTLNASLHQLVGHPAYDIERLKADLARFAFLLGGDHHATLFQPPPAL
jgi:fatty-acid desaturase